MRRRRTTTAASLVLLLAGVACGAPVGDGSAGSPTSQPPTPSTTVLADAPPELARSELADRVRPLGSARYDASAHQAPTRTVTGLSLPTIGVGGAPVEPVGVEPDGEMEVPPADEVGWYRFGAPPGAPGSAVFAAHVAYDGVDGVFRHLERLGTDDQVVVSFDDGSTASYRITEVVTLDKGALPDDLFSRQVPERLVLITCGGEFNRSLRSYESNVVAYAIPV